MEQRGEIIHIVSSAFWGGREQYALDLCRAYSDAGWKVTALTSDCTAVDAPFKRCGVKVRHFPLGRYAGLSTVLGLCHLFRKGKTPPIVHVHAFRDVFLALAARKLCNRKGVKVVFTCHRVNPCRNTALRRRMLRNLHALIFPSVLAKDTFLSSWSPVELPLREEKIHMLPNSIYTTVPPNPEPPKTGPLVAAYYGRIVQGKGLETFISALTDCRGLRTRACIAGHGDPDYIDSLKRLAERLGVMDMIDWRGNSLSMEQILDSAHFGVFPSLMPESFGLANAACMAWGRPQISTFNGAQTEYLTNGDEALLIPPSDREALARAFKRLATDADLRICMGANARVRFSRTLAWPAFAKRMTQIYTL
ncbi:MAG: glycosyltransferase family 4 protein [Prevotella sp.]|nr:glycosyltransferase family 4 protein [Prevotella sp.]MCM1075483.1 glycosyltransferase family 4 protein [Ruminococcus sp.]